jgi:hypothetical protein
MHLKPTSLYLLLDTEIDNEFSLRACIAEALDTQYGLSGAAISVEILDCSIDSKIIKIPLE